MWLELHSMNLGSHYPLPPNLWLPHSSFSVQGCFIIVGPPILKNMVAFFILLQFFKSYLFKKSLYSTWGLNARP